ncbi:MAG: AarF/ABC1/UbiB kinase family protein [Deltaproteobacteria bacterium]|nr:AarF/ABC1/UbiB kinase family protein [Deltaproteobacteria bacterium]MBV8454687.1 AarF/ABC1/UbiB kinase family protein [Deltaproteobacteria bacterium]
MERKTLTSGRARRAMKMGSLASQVGSSYLWTSLRRPFLNTARYEQELLDIHLKNARRVVESSKQLRGAFMKMVQMLSMREDLLPGEAIDILRTTQASVPPMDYRLISQQIRRELSKSPEQLFASFETEAFAAASLGQVHRARLKSGEEVAVKIQYPGVDATVEQDLGNLKLLLRTLQAIAGDLMRQKIDTKTIYVELQERLREELDYVNEARNIDEFRRLLDGDDNILIPRVIKQLSTRRVLTMTYIDGYRLADIFGEAAELELRTWVARKYYHLVWRQILEFGVLHTDPQPGNYLVTWHPKLAVLDFGSVRHFSESVRRASLQLAEAVIAHDDRSLAAALLKLGYIDRGQDPAPMVQIIYILFEPVITDRMYHPDEYDAVAKAATVGELAFEHKLYKSPRHSIFLLRALIGLDGIMKGLGVKMNYCALFREGVRSAAQATGA